MQVVENGILRSARHVAAVDRIMNAAKTKSFWGFVDEVMVVWAEIHPAQWREMIVDIKEQRHGLRDRQYATTESKHMDRRLLLRMPEFVNYAIVKMFPDYPMDRKFFNTFAKRYPAFRISEKV